MDITFIFFLGLVIAFAFNKSVDVEITPLLKGICLSPQYSFGMVLQLMYHWGSQRVSYELDMPGMWF